MSMRERKPWRRMRLGVGILLTVAMLLSACASGTDDGNGDDSDTAESTEDDAETSSDETTEEDASSDQELDEIRLGFHSVWYPNTNLAVTLMNTDILEQNGLEARFQPHTGGGTANEAFLSGEADADFIGDGPAIALAARGVPLTWTSKLVDYHASVVVREDAPYESIEDLEGATIATFLTASVHAVLLGWFEEAGLEVGEDVEVIHLSPGDFIPALRAGEIDGYMFAAPLTIVGASQDDMRFLRDEVANAGVIRMTNEYIEQDRDAAVRFMMSVKQALAYMIENKEQTEQWVADYGQVEPEIVAESARHDQNYAEAESIEDIRLHFVDREREFFEDLAQFFVNEDVIEEAPNFDEIIDLSILEEAEERLEGWDVSTVNATDGA